MAGKRPLHISEFLEFVFIDLFFFFFLVQDSTSLPSIIPLESDLEVNDKVTEEARVSVEHFLQVRRLGRSLKTPSELT